MKRFRFRPQVLLDIQERKIEQLQGELANAVREKLKIEQEIIRLEKYYHDFVCEKDNCASKRIKIEDLQMLNIYLQSLKANIEKHREILCRQQKIVSLKQEQLAVAYRRKKALEKLKEIRYIEYKQEKGKMEGRWLDDVAISGFLRREADKILI